MISLLQNNKTEETTAGVVEQAGDTAKDLGQEPIFVFKVVHEFFGDAFAYLTGTQFISNLLASAVVILLGIFIFRVLTHGVPRVLRWRRSGQDLLDAEAIVRIKRQDTAITLIRNALRYVVFAVVALFVLSIFIRNPLPATAGATILAAVIGFGAQSFLRDIIAGFSIVFEGQYAVGDFVQMEATKATGIVEEFGLRTTTIRALSGERIFIPNGTITGVTNYLSGQQRYTVEVQLRDPDAAKRVLGSLDESSDLFLSSPRLMGREENDGRIRLRLRADVLPSMEWLVEENLIERIKAAAGEDSLAAEPLIYKVDRASINRVRNLIPQSKDKM